MANRFVRGPRKTAVSLVKSGLRYAFAKKYCIRELMRKTLIGRAGMLRMPKIMKFSQISKQGKQSSTGDLGSLLRSMNSDMESEEDLPPGGGTNMSKYIDLIVQALVGESPEVVLPTTLNVTVNYSSGIHEAETTGQQAYASFQYESGDDTYDAEVHISDVTDASNIGTSFSAEAYVSPAWDNQQREWLPWVYATKRLEDATFDLVKEQDKVCALRVVVLEE